MEEEEGLELEDEEEGLEEEGLDEDSVLQGNKKVRVLLITSNLSNH